MEGKVKRAVILGATGLIGKELLKRLLDEPAYSEVTAVGRRAPNVQHPRLRTEILNLDELAKSQALKEADDVFCCLGTTIKVAGSEEAFRKVDYDGPVNAARAASGNKIQKFLVVSAMGADAGSRIFYNRTKGEMEKALETVSIPEVHVFRPSLLLGDRTENRLGERLATAVIKPLAAVLKGPLRKYRPIDARQVAHGMMQRALAIPESGTFYYPSDLLLDF